MLIALLGRLAWAAPPIPCATPTLLSDLVQWKRPSVWDPSPQRMGDGAKQGRDHFQAPHVRYSENFALRWGTSNSVNEDEAQAILDSLEIAWQVEIMDLGHPVPLGSDAYHFNVYVADTGVEGPWGPLGDFGAAGWFYPDDGAGYPFVVLARSTVADLESGGLTAAHELYHAIQSVTERYRDPEGLWFWEATATWMESQVFPHSTEYARFLYGYALLPHLPIDFHVPFESGKLEEYHSYGAFIFPLMLSEIVADASLIRTIWVEPAIESVSPMEPLTMELESLGIDLKQVLGEFAVRNADWNYSDGASYESVLEQVPIELESDGDRFVDEYWERGSGQWERPANDLEPAYMGSNLIRLWNPAGDTLHLQIVADVPDSLYATLVVQSDGNRGVHDIAMTSGKGSLEIDLDGTEDRMTLVVAAVNSAPDSEYDQYGYQYYLGNRPADEHTGSDTGASESVGCGCAASVTRSGWHWIWGMFGFSVLRVRRRSRLFRR